MMKRLQLTNEANKRKVKRFKINCFNERWNVCRVRCLSRQMNLGLHRDSRFIKVELSSQHWTFFSRHSRLIFNKLRERLEQQKNTMAQNFKWFVLQKTKISKKKKCFSPTKMQLNISTPVSLVSMDSVFCRETISALKMTGQSAEKDPP